MDSKYKNIKNDIDNYYNDKLKQVSKILDLDNQGKYKYVMKDSANILDIIDKSGEKIVLSGNFQTLGIYNHASSLWFWSWNIPFIDKSEYKDLDKITKFNETFIKKYEDYDPKDIEEIYFYIDNGNFFCISEYLSFILKLSLYLVKGVWFFPIEKKIEGVKTTQYIILTSANKIG